MKGPFLIGLVSVLFPPYGREDPPRSSRSMRTWGLDVRFGKEARVTNHSSLKTVGRRGVVLVLLLSCYSSVALVLVFIILLYRGIFSIPYTPLHEQGRTFTLFFSNVPLYEQGRKEYYISG